MAAFHGARNHDWHASTDYESNALPTAPLLLFWFLLSHSSSLHVSYYLHLHSFASSPSSSPSHSSFTLLNFCRSFPSSDQPPTQAFNTPFDCGEAMASCTEVIGLWSVGIGGACLNENMGFLIGGETGFKYAMMEVMCIYWLNSRLTFSSSEVNQTGPYLSQHFRSLARVVFLTHAFQSKWSQWISGINSKHVT